MDDEKCLALKAILEGQARMPFIAIERFFDGNEDLGSIGCNLVPHPGIESFRTILLGLLSRPDVQSVHAIISEIDPGPGSWPFSDTVLVDGPISERELKRLVSPLQPDEVNRIEAAAFDPSLASRFPGEVTILWWD